MADNNRVDADDIDRPWHTLDDNDDEPRKKGSLLREAVIIIVCVLAITWVFQTFIGRQYVIPSESMEPTLHGCTGCSNDRIMVDKLAYRFSDPKAGDVIVFKVPDTWGEGFLSPRSSNSVVAGIQNAASWFGFAPPDENDFVKRIIAVGGQTIECRNSEGVGVKVDGKPIKEPYVDMKLQQQNADNGVATAATTEDGKLNSCLGIDFGPVTIPKDHVWVMGDNRTRSSDSRYHTPSADSPEFAAGKYNGTVPVDDIRGKTRFIIWPVSRIGGVGSVAPQH